MSNASTIRRVLGDREKPGLYAAEQRRLIRQSIDREVLRFAPGWVERARASGLTHPRAVADLSVLEPRPLDEMGRPATLLIRPTVDSISREGPPALRRRVVWARLRGRRRLVGPEIIDPLFKPIHWLIERDVPVGCSEADLERLGELGRRLLTAAGIGPGDAVLSVLPSGPNLPYWQLALGARELRAPLAGLHPGTGAEPVVLLGPTVLVGRPGDLQSLLQALPQATREAITTVLVVSRAPVPPDQRSVLGTAVWPQTTIVEAWAPPGVRALWGQCPGGDGVHTWPTTELLEVCDRAGRPLADQTGEGRIVWTGLGWRGTAILRLDTGLLGRLETGPCPACRRTTPRLVPIGVEAPRPRRSTVAPPSVRRIEPEPAPVPAREPARVPAPPEPMGEEVFEPAGEELPWPAPVLVGAEGVAEWHVEHRTRRGIDEVIVHLALEDGWGLGEVLPPLERSIGATQYVVTDPTTVARRIDLADGQRVVDLRPVANGSGPVR